MSLTKLFAEDSSWRIRFRFCDKNCEGCV